jgi:hypothetical protein
VANKYEAYKQSINIVTSVLKPCILILFSYHVDDMNDSFNARIRQMGNNTEMKIVSTSSNSVKRVFMIPGTITNGPTISGATVTCQVRRGVQTQEITYNILTGQKSVRNI